MKKIFHRVGTEVADGGKCAGLRSTLIRVDNRSRLRVRDSSAVTDLAIFNPPFRLVGVLHGIFITADGFLIREFPQKSASNSGKHATSQRNFAIEV